MGYGTLILGRVLEPDYGCFILKSGSSPIVPITTVYGTATEAASVSFAY